MTPGQSTEVIRRARIPENIPFSVADMGALTVSTAGVFGYSGGAFKTLRDTYCNAVTISFFTSDTTNPGGAMTPDTFAIRVGTKEQASSPLASDLFILTGCEVRGTVIVIPLFCLAYNVSVYRLSSTGLWFPNVCFS